MANTTSGTYTFDKTFAIDDDKYLVHDSLVLASGTIVTPFANA